MLKLVFMNIKDFVMNKTGIFLFFISTLIIISFASLFLMNEFARELLNSSSMSSQFYIEFKEPIEYSEIESALKKSFISPSFEYCLNPISAKYNNIEVSTHSLRGWVEYNIAIRGDTLSQGQPIGIWSLKNNSNYMLEQDELSSGRYLNDSDKGENNAYISFYLDQYVNDDKIIVDGIGYNVVGVCREGFLGILNNSIRVDIDTFSENGNLVKIYYVHCKIPPFKGSIDKLKEIFNDNIAKSNLNSMDYFSFVFVRQALILGGFYIAVLIVLFSGLMGIFYCWLKSGKRNYLIYSFCGMSDGEKRFCLMLEMLIYWGFSSAVGIGIYYVLLNCNYKLYIYYPHPGIVVGSVLITLVICIVMTALQNRKKQNVSIVHEI